MRDEPKPPPARLVERLAWPGLAVLGAAVLATAALVPFAESADPGLGLKLRTIELSLSPVRVAIQSIPTAVAILVVAAAAIRLAVDARPVPLALGFLLGVAVLTFGVQVARLLELSLDDFLIPALGAFLGPTGSGLILIGGVLELPRHLERPAGE